MLGVLQRLPAKNRGRLIIAGIGLLVAVDYTVASYKIGLGTLANTKAGMFPFFAGLVWIVISILTGVESLNHKYADGSIATPRDRLRVVLLFALAVVAMTVLLAFLGQYITASLFGVVTVRLLGEKSWIKTFVYGVGIGVVLSYLFMGPLGVILPTGPFGW
jgi:hypothetical protein